MPPRVLRPQPVRDEAGACPIPGAARAPSWFALWVLSNAEFAVEDALAVLDIESFLPSWNERVQWSDRKKDVRRPLFPGYLFARCDAAEAAALPRIAGVIEVLPTSLKPLSLDAEDIDNVRLALASRLPIQPCPYVTGDEIRIESGPLAGVKGIVQRTRNGTRVIVRIELLQRAVSVEVDAADVGKVAA